MALLTFNFNTTATEWTFLQHRVFIFCVRIGPWGAFPITFQPAKQQQHTHTPLSKIIPMCPGVLVFLKFKSRAIGAIFRREINLFKGDNRDSSVAFEGEKVFFSKSRFAQMLLGSLGGLLWVKEDFLAL